ncbi:MAG: MFS transporter [Halorientalis sp.]
MTPTADRPESDAVAVPWGSPTVRVVLLATLLAPLGVPLVSPALPVIREALGLTDAQASLLVSAYFLTGIGLSPFIGLLTDRVGRRRVLVASVFAFSLTGSAIAVGPGFATVLAVRILQGTAAAGIFITTVTLVGDTFEGLQRNAVLGANTAVLSAGAALYPLLGGVLATVAWNAVFLAYLLGLPVGVVAYRLLPEPPGERGGRGPAYFGKVLSALSAGDALRLYGAAFGLELLLFGAVITALPFLLWETYGLSPVRIGLVITAAEVSSAAVASQNGRVARYLSEFRIVALGFAAVGVGLVGLWSAPTVALVGAAAAVVGAGWGLSLPSVDDATSDRVPAQYRAGALSLRNSATFLGRAAGPVTFTTLAVGGGYRPLLLGAGLLALAGAGVLWLSSN